MSTSILIEKQAKGKTFEYSTEDYLGCGTYGRVFKGTYIENDVATVAAIKRIELFRGNIDINRDAEVKALCALQHPHIVLLYSVEDSLDFRY